MTGSSSRPSSQSSSQSSSEQQSSAQLSSELFRATTATIAPSILYRILQLRVDVFVVEQACAYPELDGRDLESGAKLWWATDDAGTVLATLRVLEEPDGTARIGRVATAPAARGRGLAAGLMIAALDAMPGRAVVLGAQTQLSGWYARFGFAADGAEYIEDGIAHLPMRLSRG